MPRDGRLLLLPGKGRSTMQIESFRRTKFVGLLGIGICAVFCVLAIHTGLLHSQPAAGPPQASKSAQRGQDAQKAPPADAATDGNDADSADDGDDDGPSPGNFLGSTYVPSVSDANQPQLAVAAPPPPTPKPADAGGDAARQQINNETANLLAMAYALKAEVDRTNQDQLSISVVRKAGQIEQMARKVRDELRPVQQGKN
jgi:hypothetical protein